MLVKHYHVTVPRTDVTDVNLVCLDSCRVSSSDSSPSICSRVPHVHAMLADYAACVSQIMDPSRVVALSGVGLISDPEVWQVVSNACSAKQPIDSIQGVLGQPLVRTVYHAIGFVIGCQLVRTIHDDNRRLSDSEVQSLVQFDHNNLNLPPSVRQGCFLQTQDAGADPCAYVVAFMVGWLDSVGFLDISKNHMVFQGHANVASVDNWMEEHFIWGCNVLDPSKTNHAGEPMTSVNTVFDTMSVRGDVPEHAFTDEYANVHVGRGRKTRHAITTYQALEAVPRFVDPMGRHSQEVQVMLGRQLMGRELIIYESSMLALKMEGGSRFHPVATAERTVQTLHVDEVGRIDVDTTAIPTTYDQFHQFVFINPVSGHVRSLRQAAGTNQPERVSVSACNC